MPDIAVSWRVLQIYYREFNNDYQGTTFAQSYMMANMDDKSANRFEILRQLALSAIDGSDITEPARQALQMTAAFVGLEAVSLLLFDENLQSVTTVSYAESEDFQKRLVAMEEDLYGTLRKEKQLVSAYLSFGGTAPVHSFTLPLNMAGKVRGALIGLQQGDRTIVSEDLLLESLSATLSLVVAAGDLQNSGSVSRNIIEKERMAAIVETAITVNHEVNNPLTAILGNVQLLLLKRDDLDEELKSKLKVIEEAAMNIKAVTQKLLRLTSPKSKSYTKGTSMLDLSDDDE